MDSPSPACLGPLALAPDECLVLAPDGHVLALNAAAARSLGAEPEKLRGRALWELVTCLNPRSFERLVAAMRSEGPQSLLAHLRGPAGSLLAIDARMWLEHSADGERVLFVARQMRANSTVLEERDRLAQLVEESAELVLLFDRELRVTWANPAGLALLGIERGEDVVGMILGELVALEQRDEVEEQAIPRLLRERWDGELRLRSWRDPALTTPCRVHAYALRDARTRRVSGYAMTARDISARLESERRRQRLLELAELARRVATMLLGGNDLHAAIFEILDGAARAVGASRAYLSRLREDGRWVVRTHEWAPATGARHRNASEAEPEEHYRWATELLMRGEVLRIDDAVPLPLGGAHGLLAADERALLCLPVLLDGKLESLFGFVDVAPRAWAEEEVAALRLLVDSFARGLERQKAERATVQARRELEEAIERERVASRYKSEFLASMSHELRTPMNAIRGYAELLARPHPERAVQEVWIQNLRRSTEYLLGLVHDVLDLSKIEAGHMRLEKSSTSLADVLGSVEDLLAAGAREKCLDFSVALEGDCPETFDCDPVRLKQILVNLASNAIKFTSQGSVRVRARQRGSESAGHTLEVTVTDTGIGIPSEAIDKLFRPFSQVHQRAGGTGLGLQISRSLARLLEGDISVQSEVGKGTTFVLELPLEGASGRLTALPARSLPVERPRTLPAALRGKRVLVVDDSLENREVLRFLLQEAGAVCEAAANGKAGVELAVAAERARAPFDAVLMDMNMPVMDGFEATRALVQACVTSPVIALTALALQGDEERCRAAGCADYVGKPIVPSQFYETIARHVRAGETPAATPSAPAGDVLSIASPPRFRGLVERYVASFPELVGRIRLLARARRHDEIRTLVHRLRGTAATYGFPAVSQAAGRCEDAIRAGRPAEEITALLDELLGRLSLAAAG
ncbi:MAG: ATP-binding protein [Planctomycetota bacterium]